MQMKSDPTNDFKFAVTAAPWALRGAPVLLCGEMRAQFEQAKAMGYDAVELHLRTPHEAPADEMAKLCETYGIRIAAVATGLAKLVDNLCYIDNDVYIRKAAVERTKEFIDWAGALQSGIVIGSMRGTIPDVSNRELYLQRMAVCMGEILEAAEKKGVPIYLEIINRYENNFLNTAEETLAYIDRYNSKYLFAHLDTFHMNIEESNMEKAILLCKGKLAHFHVADNQRHPCGTGTLDFAGILGALREISYTGYISVECLPVPDGISAAKTCIANLKQKAKEIQK